MHSFCFVQWLQPARRHAKEFVFDLVLAKPYQPKVLDEIVRMICGESEASMPLHPNVLPSRTSR